ncbi:MAG: toxin-antitoxin system HicB family antitoxin [Candidatus Poseidonia sp.]|nr:toxin-antitoxin system HicB family antitoxin [Poseidonia sp.]
MSKKRLLLRIDPALHEDLRAWAEQDFRSINAQIEFILNQAVSKRKRSDK